MTRVGSSEVGEERWEGAFLVKEARQRKLRNVKEHFTLCRSIVSWLIGTWVVGREELEMRRIRLRAFYVLLRSFKCSLLVTEGPLNNLGFVFLNKLIKHLQVPFYYWGIWEKYPTLMHEWLGLASGFLFPPVSTLAFQGLFLTCS